MYYHQTLHPTSSNKITANKWDEQHLKEFDIRRYGAVSDGVTDDTQAVKDALAACVDAGGGTIIFPKGITVLSGDLTQDTYYNSIIPLPYKANNSTTEPICIEFRGEISPPLGYVIEFTGCKPPTNASIIYAKTSASGTSPSVIGGRINDPDQFDHESWSNIRVIFKDLIFRQKDNPELINLNLKRVYWASLDNCGFDVDAQIPDGISQPTNSNAIALLLPVERNAAFTTVDTVFVTGYYIGIQFSEHSSMNNLFIQACYKALVATGSNHTAHIGRVLCQWNNYPLSHVILNEDVPDAHIIIENFDLEDAGNRWYTNTATIYDPNNNIYGIINLHHDGPVITGATNLTINRF